MNWDAISAVAEVAGAIVVIISLIYVAAQIRQNTNATAYQTTQSLIHANSESAYILATNPELADLFLRGTAGRDCLSETEKLQFNTYVYGYFNQVDFAYEHYKNGQVTEDTWKKMGRELPAWLSLPGIQEWWMSDKTRLSKNFVSYLEEELKSQGKNPHIPTIPTEEKNAV